jgi:hypothetical protein
LPQHPLYREATLRIFDTKANREIMKLESMAGSIELGQFGDST